MKAILSYLTAGRIIALILCAVLAGLAYLLKFHMLGYSFSALVCLVLICILLFYTFMPLAGLKWPVFAKIATKVFTTCLILGVLVVAVTEAVVIYYSFGSPEQQVDYVVVLGAKIRPTGPSASLWDRIYAAYDYLEAHPDTIAVVSGGKGLDEPEAEADAMFNELVMMGIDPARIWSEDRATSTWENLHFSLDLIERNTGSRPTKLGVLSSEYHLFRASLFTRACGVEFVGIPARTSRISQAINHFMREVAGVWHYIILGGQYD